MDQLNLSKTTSPSETRRAKRIAKGYTIEDLAIATGLTAAEIAASEQTDAAPEHHVERIEHVLV
jgi:transcriptional regulator with XRE-family HTH domain